MQEPSPYATKGRVGCITWLAAIALALAMIGMFLDITQELAWNNRMAELDTLASRLSSIPIEAPPERVAVEPVQIQELPTLAPEVQEPVEVQAPVTVNSSASGVSYETICDVDESNMTDPQLEAHAASFAGRTFTGWNGWVYDVVSRSDGTYNLEIAMRERGFLWTRDIVVNNIPTDLALRLNVEQPITFDGRISEVKVSFEIMCNPMIVDDFVMR